MGFETAMLVATSDKTPSERFQIAKEHLDKCREALADAQTRFIEAERFYAAASREYTRNFFGKSEISS